MTLFLLLFSLFLLFFANKFNGLFDPAWFFAMQWVGFISVVLIFCQDFIKVEYVGMLFILLAVFSFCFGSWSVNLFVNKKHRITPPKNLKISKKLASILLFLLLIVAFYYPIEVLYTHGYSLSNIFDIKELLSINNEMSVARYTEGDKNYSLATQFMMVFTYLTPLLGGFCFRLLSRKMKLICLLTLLPSFFAGFTQAAKMAMITSVFLWCTGLIVCSISYNFRLRPSLLQWISSVICIFVFFLLLFTTMVMRTGRTDSDTVEIIKSKFVEYAVGSVPCFDIWYSNTELNWNYSYGTKTFYGISNFIGLAKREQGVYTVPVDFGIGKHKLSSNVYTIFRSLVEDYSSIGACIFLFFLGFISNFCIYMLKRFKTNAFLWQAILIGVYAYVLWSFVTSFFAYTSYIVMLVLVCLILFVLQTKISIVNIKKRRKQSIETH